MQKCHTKGPLAQCVIKGFNLLPFGPRSALLPVMRTMNKCRCGRTMSKNASECKECNAAQYAQHMSQAHCDEQPIEARLMVSRARRLRQLAGKAWSAYERASKRGHTED